MIRPLLALALVLLAAPAWAQVPNRIDTVRAVAAADPARFACAHTTAACAFDFVKALVCELRKTDPRWFWNGKRGNANDPSWDAIHFVGAGPARNQRGEPITIIDVIAGAGGPDPRPAWIVFESDPTAGASLVPDCEGSTGGGTGSGGGNGGHPAVDLAPVLAELAALKAQIARLSAQINTSHAALTLSVQDAAGLAQTAAHDANVAAREVLVVKDWLAQGLMLRLSARWVGTLTGEATVKTP